MNKETIENTMIITGGICVAISAFGALISTLVWFSNRNTVYDCEEALMITGIVFFIALVITIMGCCLKGFNNETDEKKLFNKQKIYDDEQLEGLVITTSSIGYC